MASPASLPYVLHAGLLVLHPGITLAIGYWAYRRNPGPLGQWFLVATAMNACWGLTIATRFFAAPLATKAFVYQYVKTLFVWGSAFSWLVVALYYAGLDRQFRRVRVPLGLAFAAILGSQLFFIASGQVWANFRIVAEPFRHMEYTRLTLFWVYASVGYLVVGTAAVLVLETMRRAGRIRLQPLLFSAAMSIMIFADLGTRLDLFFVPGFDYAGPAGTANAAVLGFLVARHRLMSVAPLSRHDVMEAVRDGVVAVSPDRLVVDYNSRATAAFPDLDGAVGDTLDEAAPELVDGDADPPFAEKFTLDTPEGRRTFTVGVDRLESAGRHRGWTITLRDVTDMEEYARDLEQQTQQLDRFASVVSHDLRNPLNVSRGFLGQAREDVDDPRVDRARDALDRMEEIIDDALTMAREGRAVEERTWDLLHGTVHEAWETSDTGDATLDLEVPTNLEVRADHPRLRTLLENLFRNCVEHGSTGSRTRSDDSVEHGPETATVRVGATDGGFYVEDDGPGIPEGERDRVFDQGYTTQNEGTGFGLAIVESIATAHGWSVAVSESPEGGARFSFTGLDDDTRTTPSALSGAHVESEATD